MKIYSTDGECFRIYENWQEAAQEYFMDNEVGVGVIIEMFEGDQVSHNASYYLSSICDDLYDRASDEHGEIADGWEFSDDEKESLQAAVVKAVDQWADEHDTHPWFFGVDNVRVFKVRAIDEDGNCEMYQDHNQPPIGQ